MFNLRKYFNSKRPGKIIFNRLDINYPRNHPYIFILYIVVFVIFFGSHRNLFNCLEHIRPGAVVPPMQNISV
jgi:hypothetical protein